MSRYSAKKQPEILKTMASPLLNEEEEKKFIANETYQPPFFTVKTGVKERQIDPCRLIGPFLQKEEEARKSMRVLIDDLVSASPDNYKKVARQKGSIHAKVISTEERFAIFKDEPEILTLIEDFVGSTFKVLKNKEQWVNDLPV